MPFIDSIGAEFHRYQDLADAAIAQVTDDEVARTAESGSNSIATIAWHLAGNFRSRFTDFLTTDGDLDRTVTIRGRNLQVDEALHRSLAHASYHVGQIVYLAKGFRGADWHSLSIPPGQSEADNRRPTRERNPQGGR